jgi:hypothetical protein
MCEEAVAASDVVVITHGGKVFAGIPELLNANQVLIDLVGKSKSLLC